MTRRLLRASARVADCESLGACNRLLAAREGGRPQVIKSAEENCARLWSQWKLAPSDVALPAPGAPARVCRQRGLTLLAHAAASDLAGSPPPPGVVPSTSARLLPSPTASNRLAQAATESHARPTPVVDTSTTSVHNLAANSGVEDNGSPASLGDDASVSACAPTTGQISSPLRRAQDSPRAGRRAVEITWMRLPSAARQVTSQSWRMRCAVVKG